MQYTHCHQCFGHKYAKYTPYKASPKKLMVIGESPTPVDTRTGALFSGHGANVLKTTMESVGLPVDTKIVHYTTAVKCAVPKKKGSKFPEKAPLNCHHHLLQEIKEVNPEMILVCGANAYATLVGHNKSKITEKYGRVEELSDLPGIKIMPIMNPGVLLYKPGDFKPFKASLSLAATLFNGGSTVDTGITKWNVLSTEQEVIDLRNKMIDLYNKNQLDVASYDIETTDLDYRKAEFLVMGVCFEKNYVYVIPRELKEYVKLLLEDIPWRCIWQHGKYDKKVCWSRKIGTVDIDEDTLYMHYVLDETSSHDLGHLTKTFLNADEYKYKMNQNWKAVTLDTYDDFFDALCERVSVDCDYSLQLYKKFTQILNEEENANLKKLYKELLIPAANFLSRVEQNGILIDAEYLNELDEKYTKLLNEVLQRIQTLAEPFWSPETYMFQTGAKSASVKFNPGSPKQMSWMVFDRLKLKPRIKRGKSTAKEVLDSIENAPELIKAVREYRSIQKEHSTYVLGLLDARDTDGRVRTNFTLHVTATGRLSSKEPNIQNQPSANGVGNIRKAFKAAPSHILAEIDYSGAELRWLAFLSKCPVLSEVFIQGRNLHNETATKIYGPNFTKQEKMRAKAANFGIAYGREPKSFKEEYNITMEEAVQMVEGWLNAYPGARDYLHWCANQVELGNKLETPFGRQRRFGLVSPMSLHALQNEAKNFPIQSSSSDLLLCSAMLGEKAVAHLGVKVLNLIHDSILLEIPADWETVKETGYIMNDIMVNLPKKMFNCPIPFKTDFEIGVNWGEMVTFDYRVENTQCVHLHEDDEEYIDYVDWLNSKYSK